jgi:hypothetical protein
MFLGSYNTPKCTDTAVCLCFFSPAGFVNPKKNFLYVEGMLKRASIPYFTAECVIGDQTPFLDNPTLRTYSSSHLFYKEQLYNKLVPHISEQYTKLIFMDADIIFSDSNWVDTISNVLNTHDVVQPFQTAIWLSKDKRTVLRKLESSIYGIHVHKIDPKLAVSDRYHSGFSFAMTRSLFNKLGGVFDKAIVGGGDCLLLKTLFKITSTSSISPFIVTEFVKYIETRTFSIRCGYLPCTVYHLYHGSIANRNYVNRHKHPYLIALPSWDHAVTLNESGMYELKDKKIDTLMQNYFRSRNEDS